MKLSEIINCIQGKVRNKNYEDKEITQIKIDSRLIKKGDVYVAIKGPKNNGHKFVKEAFEKGAIAAIVSDTVRGITDELLIRVENTNNALLDIAHYYKSKFNIPFIAITGSVGKTTTKELLALILSTKYNILKSEKNYNNIYGVPLTLLNLDEDHEIGIIEIGMNHMGEISKLSTCVNPNTAIITSIGTSHIGYLKNKKNILNAKMEILNGMNSNGILFVNGDDEYLDKITPDVKLVKCGFKNENEFEGFDVISDLYLSTFNVEYNHEIYEIEVNLPGHLLPNVLLAIRVGLEYGIEIQDIVKVLKTYRSHEMRMNIEKLKSKITLIDDSYNASFESMSGILEILATLDDDKILILGEMKELGKYTKRIHKALKEYIVNVIKRELLLVGSGMKSIKISGAKYFDNYEQVINYLNTKNIEDKLMLVKGSRSVNLNKVCDYLREKY